MTRRVKLQRREGVALITMSGRGRDGARAGFDADLRGALGNALELALAEPGVRAIILRADPEVGGWPFSPDPLIEYEALQAPGDPAQGLAPGLAALCDRVAGAPLPVVAELSGVISGAGLALALAAGGRIASAGTVFLSREHALGCSPAAGAVVRLAQRVGAARALDFLLLGRPVPALREVSAGLCDTVVAAQDLNAAAMARALEAAGGQMPGLPDRRQALAEMGRFFDEVAEMRKRVEAGPLHDARQRLIGVVEAAALLPMREALDFEAVAHHDLAGAPLAQGLIHADRVRRQAGRVPDEPPTAPPPEPVGLWSMGDRLALELAKARRQVIFAGPEERVARARRRILKEVSTHVASGRLDAAQAEVLTSRITFGSKLHDLAAARLIYAAPAVPGEADLAALRGIVAGHRILIVVFGSAAGPGEIRMHRAARLRELAPEEGIGPEALARAAAPLRRAGLVVIFGDGVADRLEGAFFAAAERCVMAGALPDAVDRALEAFGFAAGPFRRLDAMGLRNGFTRLAAAHRAPGPYLSYLDLLGQSGEAAGQGVYRHRPGDAPELLPETAGKP
ncbi:MAG: enoyl-CoA hydratase-related protein [Paracoccaceae bacterium]